MKQTFRWYKVSLMFSVIATALASGIIGNILGDIVEEYQLQDYQNGFVSSCISIGSLAALIIGIGLRKHVSKVQFICAGGILMGIALMTESLPISYGTLLLVSVVFGVGVGIADSNQSSFIVDLEPQNAGKNLGLLHSIFGIGALLLPPLILKLLSVMDWHAVCFLLGAVIFVLIVQFLLFSRTAGKTVKQTTRLEKSNSWQQIKKFLRSRQFRVLWFCMFVGAAAQNGILVWTVRYVSDFLHNRELATICLSVFWMTSTISRIYACRLPLAPLQTLAIGSILSGCAWGIAVCLDSAAAMMIACFIAGLGSGCCIPILLSEGAEFDAENTGLSANMMMIIKTAGQILCPLFISFVMELTTLKIALLCIAPLLIIDGVTAAALKRIKRHHAFL